MNLPALQQVYIPLKGGLDQSTPSIEAASGSLMDSSNFEVNVLGGYRRVDGYEKYDGTTMPNEYGYYQMLVATVAPVTLGSTLVSPNGSTGLVIQTDAEGYVYYVKPAGAFLVGDQLTISGVPVCNVLAEPYQRKDRSTQLSALCMALSSDEYRKDIGSVPGAGPIRGLCYYQNSLYAFRNNAGNTACAVYKSSGSGWQSVSLGIRVDFTAASGTLVEGQTLTKGSVTAVIQRVVIRTGSLGAGTAAGSLMLSAVAGGNFSAGAATTSGATLTLSGAQSAVTLFPLGKFRFVLSNFGSGQKMYFVSGEDYAYEFDGTNCVAIVTGMAVDKPSLLAVHKNHLFLAFDNSLQHSGIGNPYSWSAVLGAAELNMGESITNLLPNTSDADSGGSMVVSTRNTMYVLYGTSAADWKLTMYQRDVGALKYTMQNIASNAYYFDDRGVTNLTQTLNFGNFQAATISDRVRPWLMERKFSVIDSCIVKEKNQYRLFFDGGISLYMTFSGASLTGCMPIQYEHNITAVHSCEVSTGVEGVFYGDDNGNVYLADNGPSFAGATITAFFKTHYNHCKSPRQKKRFRKITFEVGGGGFADFQVGTELGYGNYEIDTQPIELIDAQFAGPRWDDPSVFWDNGVWDGRILLPVEVQLYGTEENIAITVYQTSRFYMSLNFQSALLQYTPRRAKR